MSLTFRGEVTQTRTAYPTGGVTLAPNAARYSAVVRIGSTLYYVLKDHLGSASVVTDATANATVVGEDRFGTFGQTRFINGTMYTDKLFTGQRKITGLGIYHLLGHSL